MCDSSQNLTYPVILLASCAIHTPRIYWGTAGYDRKVGFEVPAQFTNHIWGNTLYVIDSKY